MISGRRNSTVAVNVTDAMICFGATRKVLMRKVLMRKVLKVLKVLNYKNMA